MYHGNEGWVDSPSTQSNVSSLIADISKTWISVGREEETVKDVRECQSAKINRWIKTTADVSLFTFCLLSIHLLLFLSSLSSSDAARNPENADKQLSGRFQPLYLHCIQENETLQPLAALHPRLTTLSLPHSSPRVTDREPRNAVARDLDATSSLTLL